MPGKMADGEYTRTYVINLRRVYSAPRKKRAKVAVRAIRDFIARHLRFPDRIKISPELNLIVWSRSIEKPPRKVKVDVSFKVEDGRVTEVEVLPHGAKEQKTTE
ncbi:50S ribosomal protein L31e [Thermofilum pendens]|uniref:Large ribosomal subunit protein eL31 n=1 Tax=Thermofilum pendens (strain DSM 2475 / Hrk 5) TaxID=368408 RepID=A1RXF2_THEPD|nr:50S ribosomal protein L31e [Thermofilum pendens]ABL77882.1 LSU ribosomal protein L31E [Thermofilum pendens Hrk 5]